VRDIQPTDYVCLHTGYKFPEKRNPVVRELIMKTIRSMWDDDDMVSYILRIIASQLHGTKKFEEFYVWTGRGGNGKGLLSTLLEKTLGDYFHSIPSTCITKPSDKKDAPNPPIAKAKGKRFVQAQEPEADDKLQIGTIKELTGGDLITARQLYGNTVVYLPQFGLFLQTNGIPVLNKIDGGIKRRLRIIKFPFDFKEFPTEPHHRLINIELKELCKSPEWRDEFIHILLDVYPTIGSSLKVPAFVKEETDEYLGENNLLRDWLPANYEHNKLSDREYLVSAQELLMNYKSDNPDRKDMTPAKFKSMMEMCGVQQLRMSNNFKVGSETKPAGSYYVGLKRRNTYGEE
jgi:P4 family phage/plasmid primase-like protien